MKKALICLAIVGQMSVVSMSTAYAADGVVEKTGEAISEGASDTGKVVKKGYRAAKDKTCHLVNGKMECAAQKVKHAAQNAGDEVSDKTDDVKKKID